MRLFPPWVPSVRRVHGVAGDATSEVRSATIPVVLECAPRASCRYGLFLKMLGHFERLGSRVAADAALRLSQAKRHTAPQTVTPAIGDALPNKASLLN